MKMKRLLVMLLCLVLVVAGVACAPAETTNPTEAPAVTDEAKATDAPKDTDAPAATKAADATEAPADATPAAVEYKQSPFLDDKGLAPVAERLPKVPAVTKEIKPEFLEGGVAEIGKYGGTMRMFNPGVDWNPDIFLMLNEAVLSTPSILGEEILPNIFESWEASEDITEFTFKLREGLKWSDGAPVTMDDVKFAIEDVLFNEELNTAGVPNRFRTGNLASGTPMVVTYVDDWTFKVKFDKPYGRFTTNIALTGWVGYTDLIKPRHVLEKWHTKYGKMDEIKAKAEELEQTWEKDGDWINVFNYIDVTNWELCNPQAIGFPSLYPWIQVSHVESVKTYERNPYYFKVDAEGNQLPYIDKVVGTYVTDVEMVNVKVLAGEVDMLREDAALSKMTLYRDNEKNGFTAHILDTHVTPASMIINQTFGDEAMNTTQQDLRFRQALTYATDYQEVIDAIYMGFGSLPVLHQTTFDVAKGNALLDEMGMTKGADGLRLMADGKKYTSTIEISLDAPELPEVGDMVSTQWKENLGLDVSAKVIAGELKTQRTAANELQMTCQWTVEPMWKTAGWTDFANPGYAGRLWQLWLDTKGEQGKEPPAYVKRMYDFTADVMASLPGSPESDAIYAEIYKTYQDNVIIIETGSDFKQPLILNTDMGNVAKEGTAVSVDIGGEQLFYRNPDQH